LKMSWKVMIDKVELDCSDLSAIIRVRGFFIKLFGTRILSVCPFAKYSFPLLDGVCTPKLLLPFRNSKQPKEVAMKMSNFGIHF
jgi:hypothetical protein